MRARAAAARAPARPRRGLGDELARRAVARVLGRIADGRVEVADGGRRWAFGPPDADVRATVTVSRERAWRRALRGSTGLADGYVDGDWDADDLVALFRVAARNVGGLDRVRARWHPLLHAGQRLARLVPGADRAAARRNVAAHYDLGNRLFGRFLDTGMTYSCARFETPDATLEQAQIAKLDGICRALELRPGTRLLEVGTGWGALAIHAAREYGARVTTTTISREQAALARERVAAAGLADRVTVLDADYRDLRGRHERLVSVEMVEAVGWRRLPAFFARCSELLEPDGLMLLQAITIDDDAYEVEKASRSFANTHVFPGGCLPSTAVIDRCVAARTDMRPVWREDITAHYVPTLRHWRARFEAAWPELARLGYDERFRRLWQLYLCYVEAGFAERRIGDVQLLLAKPGWRAGVEGGASVGPREQQAQRTGGERLGDRAADPPVGAGD